MPLHFTNDHLPQKRSYANMSKNEGESDMESDMSRNEFWLVVNRILQQKNPNML